MQYAVTATQPKMVAFLLTQGADPLLEDHNMLYVTLRSKIGFERR